MSTITERISAIGIMPVIAKLESEADCAALADALTRGGIPQMEITFRMEGAENYIRYARSYAPDMIVGAGTVTTIEQAQKAIDAGAQFIVAPGLNPQIVKFCQQTMLGLKLAHIGVNEPDEQAAYRDAAAFNDLLVLDAGNNGTSSVFSGKLIEVMKAPSRGANGHIGFSTPCLDRAVRYFEAMGTKFDPSTAKRDVNGNLKAIYFEKEIGGFAIHLLKA